MACRCGCKTGGCSSTTRKQLATRRVPGGWFEDAWNGASHELATLGAQAGKTVCTWIPVEARKQLVDVVTKNKALFANPWFSQTVGLFPAVFADFAQTCDFSAAARSYACRIVTNCEIIVGLTPAIASGAALASGICAATGVGIVAVPDILVVAGTLSGVAAVALPLARAICANRAPNMSDLLALVSALGQCLSLIGVKGIPTTVADDWNKMIVGVSKVAGDSGAKVKAIVDAGKKYVPPPTPVARQPPTMSAAPAAGAALGQQLRSSSGLTYSTQQPAALNASPTATTQPPSSSSGLLLGGLAAAAALLVAAHH